MRLNRFLASAGLGSRRSVEELITTGQVRINGHVITELSTQVRPEDSVKVGARIVRQQNSLTAVLAKPRGFVCTADDECERRTIFELLPTNWPRVHHVGRLDMDSEGLLIVTNDGDLSLALTHPRYKVDKEYEVLIDKPLEQKDRDKLLRGFHIMGGRAKAERVEIIGPKHLRLTLNQGIKRQIRLMLYELGYEVERLVRTRIGQLKIAGMRPGEWRILTGQEITDLKGDGIPAPRPAARPRRPAAQPAPTPASSASKPRPRSPVRPGPRPPASKARPRPRAKP